MTEHAPKNHRILSIAAVLERASVNYSEHLQKMQYVLEEAIGSRVIPGNIPVTVLGTSQGYLLIKAFCISVVCMQFLSLKQSINKLKSRTCCNYHSYLHRAKSLQDFALVLLCDAEQIISRFWILLFSCPLSACLFKLSAKRQGFSA